MKFRFLAPALVELTEAAEYYEDKERGLGADFIGEADTAIERVLKFPETWSRISEEFRHCNFRRFPYTVIYLIEPENEILIASIFHQHRRPLSWRENL